MRELGPKIPHYRRNYGSQPPNGCICGPCGKGMAHQRCYEISGHLCSRRYPMKLLCTHSKSLNSEAPILYKSMYIQSRSIVCPCVHQVESNRYDAASTHIEGARQVICHNPFRTLPKVGDPSRELPTLHPQS